MPLRLDLNHFFRASRKELFSGKEDVSPKLLPRRATHTRQQTLGNTNLHFLAHSPRRVGKKQHFTATISPLRQTSKTAPSPNYTNEIKQSNQRTQRLHATRG